MNDDRVQFWVLYSTRFADGFGFITLVTLLPSYINVLDPSGATIFGVTVGAGFVIGMYTTGFTLAQDHIDHGVDRVPRRRRVRSRYSDNNSQGVSIP